MSDRRITLVCPKTIPCGSASMSAQIGIRTFELAAVLLGHKRMTTTDEHYNDRDMDDLKRAAELIEGAFWKDFAPEG